MIILWTNKAKQRLAEIFTYCIIEFGVSVAIRFKETIDNDMKLLSHHPYIGKTEGINYKSYMIRSLLEGHYKILYYVDVVNNTIYIVNLFDCRQNRQRIEDDLN